MCVYEANSFIRLKSFLIESEIPVSRQNSGISKMGPVIPARRFRRDGFDTSNGCV